jgi:hypothetical protein
MDKPGTSTDEIDLGQMFSRIGDFFIKIGFGILQFIATLRLVPIRNKVLFIVITIASVVVGYSYAKYLKKKFYESTMILSSDYFNKRLVDNSIDKLNLLAGESTKTGLAKILGISDTLASNIIGFGARPFVAENDVIELEVLKEQLKNAQASSKNEKVIEQVVKRIEIENRHAYEITVRTLSPTVIENLQTALVNYFRNNTYIKRRIEVNKSNLIERKVKLLHDLQKLDSLKSIIYTNYKSMASQTKQGSNNVILSDKAVTDPVQIYYQDTQIYSEFQKANVDIYLQKDFEVIDGFTEFSEPTSASTKQIVYISFLVGIALSYLIVALISFNKYLATIS